IGPLFSQLMPMMEASPVYSVARNASGDCWFTTYLLTLSVIYPFGQNFFWLKAP
uniref:Uncharacterized protein n=1 Tax=Setaria italica TaxID=4555 RepID=A0A0Q3SXN8_SETIT